MSANVEEVDPPTVVVGSGLLGIDTLIRAPLGHDLVALAFRHQHGRRRDVDPVDGHLPSTAARSAYVR
jgi:hypothetical protein